MTALTGTAIFTAEGSKCVPNGVVGAEANPLGDRAVLLRLLRQDSLDPERLLGRLQEHRSSRNIRAALDCPRSSVYLIDRNDVFEKRKGKERFMVSVANSTNTGKRGHTGRSKPRYSHGPIKLTHQSPEACTSQLCTAPRNHNIHIRSHHNCNTIGATTTNDRYAVRGFCAMKRSNPTKPKLSVALARLISRPSQAQFASTLASRATP